MPSFTWSFEEFSPQGVPILYIQFPDGGNEDKAILTSHSPIPLRQDETEFDLDFCIFKGHLKNEANVFVTLTGGCPFDDSFDVRTLLSE